MEHDPSIKTASHWISWILDGLMQMTSPGTSSVVKTWYSACDDSCWITISNSKYGFHIFQIISPVPPRRTVIVPVTCTFSLRAVICCKEWAKSVIKIELELDKKLMLQYFPRFPNTHSDGDWRQNHHFARIVEIFLRHPNGHRVKLE